MTERRSRTSLVDAEQSVDSLALLLLGLSFAMVKLGVLSRR